jgi:hypothetical protein
MIGGVTTEDKVVVQVGQQLQKVPASLFSTDIYIGWARNSKLDSS